MVNLLSVSQNRELRRISGYKRKEAIGGGWRQLNNDELHNLFSSPDIIRRVRWARHIAYMEEKLI
jgi:hypothetical protein